jgi:hypothetical protein
MGQPMIDLVRDSLGQSKENVSDCLEGYCPSDAALGFEVRISGHVGPKPWKRL